MDFPICLETHRFMEPITVEIVGADIIRPYGRPEDFFTTGSTYCNKICANGCVIKFG